jgi:NitT/TauT family transport system permease protein
MTRASEAVSDGGPVPAHDDGAMQDGPVGTVPFLIKLWSIRLALLVVLLAAWEWATRTVIDPFWISSPTEIAGRLVDWVADGSLWFHLGITVEESAAGFVLGAVSGMALGFVLGRNAFLSRVLDPFILAIYSLPKVALAPLFILWFGIGVAPKIVLAAVIVFFLVFYNTFAGVRDADQDLIDVVRLMRGSPMDVMRLAVIPSTMVWVFTGLRISVPYALIGAVVGEMMASNKGIGSLIAGAAGQFDTAGVFAALFVLMVVSTILNQALNRAEHYIMRWKVSP